MTSLYLPAPVRSKAQEQQKVSTSTQLTTSNGPQTNFVQQPLNTQTRAPSYEERCRSAAEFSKLTPEQRKKAPKLFVPRSTSDFDDGGAFPEIHVAQYPRNMGNPHLNKRKVGSADQNTSGNNSNNRQLAIPGSSSSTTKAIVNVQIDSDGNKDFTSLVRGGTNSDKKVYAHHRDLKGYTPTEDEIALPSQQEEEETAAKTQAAFNAMLSSKVAMDKASGSALANAATSKNQEEKTQFIEYKSNPNAPGYNPTAAKRIIQMVPAQLDPMMPPKHKHTKAPAGPADDFVPVLHAPPEKLSKEERDAWNVPACISNWKNTRGYTIPLDKRLAADGRGLRDDTTINSNFATLSESLYLAERQAREEVRLRALVQKRQAESEREKRENELRELAMKARMERGGVSIPESHPARDNTTERDFDGEDDIVHADSQNRQNHDNQSQDHGNHHDTSNSVHVIEDESTKAEAEKRERIRETRRRELEREMRMEKHKPQRRDEDEDVAIKKARLGDRDISEKIALGVHTGGGGGLGGVDGRLYNQSGGLSSGFGAEDEYNTYSKPMFDREGVTSSSIYRPTRGEAAMDADTQYEALKKGATSKFQPDRGFAGAESGGTNSGPRTAPVQFEKGDRK
jgi:SNW domain-containing protein 1